MDTTETRDDTKVTCRAGDTHRTVTSSDIHPALLPGYINQVAGANEVKTQAHEMGCGAATLGVIVAVIACFIYGGWICFPILLVSIVSYFVVNANLTRNGLSHHCERIQMMEEKLPLVGTTEGEKLYIAAFLSIANTCTLQCFQSTTLVQSLNSLLGDYNILEQQKSVLKKTLGNQSSTQTLSDISAVEEDSWKATDTQLLTTNSKNLTILKSQLEDIHTLELNLSRVSSQQNTVIAALNSIRLILGRAQLASLRFEMVDIDQITDVIGLITSETRAVEMAIEEVMYLKANDSVIWPKTLPIAIDSAALPLRNSSMVSQ